jgi:hypothetical protein
MPSPSSQADIIVDAEGMLDALSRDPVLQAGVVDEHQELDDALDAVRVLKGQQKEHNARRQETTQLLLKALERLREAALRLRAAVKAKLGPYSERLVQFNVAPIRRRSRKPEKPPEEEPDPPPPPPPTELVE